jgi:hypothetical protein
MPISSPDSTLWRLGKANIALSYSIRMCSYSLKNKYSHLKVNEDMYLFVGFGRWSQNFIIMQREYELSSTNEPFHVVIRRLFWKEINTHCVFISRPITRTNGLNKLDFPENTKVYLKYWMLFSLSEQYFNCIDDANNLFYTMGFLVGKC